MKKRAMSIILVLIICSVFSISLFAQNPPEAFKDEYIGIDSDRNEIYNDDDDWTIYYSFVDDMGFLEYLLSLQKSGYIFVESKPDYVKDYEIKAQKPSFGKDEKQSVKMAKQDYARLLITYYNYSGVKNSNGFEYTMSVKISPGNEPSTQPASTQQPTNEATSEKTATDIQAVSDKEASQSSCSVCGFCSQPGGQCIFVCVVIFAAVALIIFGTVVAIKKKNNKIK